MIPINNPKKINKKILIWKNRPFTVLFFLLPIPNEH